MKILAIGDIHGSVSRVQKIMELIHNKNVELVLITGDLTEFGDAREAEEVLKPIENLKTKDFKILAVPGNMDSPAILEILEKKGISLHGKKEKIGEFAFVGFGGGIEGNAGNFLSSEEKIKKTLLELMQGEKNIVLLTHLPPIDTNIDKSSSGMPIGSKAVKEVLKETQPLLHICGHAHSSFGEEKIGKTISINIGAVKEGRALLLELGEKAGEEVTWKEILI